MSDHLVKNYYYAEPTEEDPHMAGPRPYSTPRWVKVFGIIALVLVLLVIIMFAGGGSHGPSRHRVSVALNATQRL